MATIGFIGMGNMGYSILKGVKSTFSNNEIVFHSKSKEKMDKIQKEEGIKAVETNSEVIEEAKYIILAVKPQVFNNVTEEIKDSVKKDSVIISLAPGFTLAHLEELCGTKRIVRTMPNTPAMVGEGMTGLCYDEKNFTEEEKNIIENIFSSVGKMSIIDEKLMDAVVCASGSSPAYVFIFIEALADSIVKCGMPRTQAYEFVAQTVLGSAKLMLETNMHPGELKDMVCSPGGTTIAGVEQLENNGFRKALFAATKACFDKCNNIK